MCHSTLNHIYPNPLFRLWWVNYILNVFTPRKYSCVKCYSGIRALADLSMNIRNSNKHFWRHCLGRHWLKLYTWIIILWLMKPWSKQVNHDLFSLYVKTGSVWPVSSCHQLRWYSKETCEKSLTSCRSSANQAIGTRTSHLCTFTLTTNGSEDPSWILSSLYFQCVRWADYQHWGC